jgi:hypothetical protein
MAHPYYQVFMQPLVSQNVYGINTDISDYVVGTELGAIYRSIDAYQSTIGVFRFSNLNIKCVNLLGYFNDTGSFFTFKRDLAKVIVYFYDKTGISFANYKGVLNEAGTNTGVNNDTISFLVTARESILNQVQVTDSDISDDDSFQNAIKAILNKAAITAVMGYDADKITVAYNNTIDVASELHNLDTKTVLDYLLQVSNSIFYIDSAGDMVVSSRAASSNTVEFYGAQDIYGRENIIQLFNYHGGYQRIYNSVTVNDQTAEDATSIDAHGLRRIDFSFSFLTTNATELSIAETIRDEFKDRKKECSIKVATEQIRNINILDKAILNLIVSNYNNIDITSDQTWKIMGITEYPSNFTTDIHLRETII